MNIIINSLTIIVMAGILGTIHTTKKFVNKQNGTLYANDDLKNIINNGEMVLNDDKFNTTKITSETVNNIFDMADDSISKSTEAINNSKNLLREVDDRLNDNDHEYKPINISTNINSNLENDVKRLNIEIQNLKDENTKLVSVNNILEQKLKNLE